MAPGHGRACMPTEWECENDDEYCGAVACGTDECADIRKCSRAVPLNRQGSAAELSVEQQQEQLLRAKYGGLLSKKKVGPKDHRYFDSADWAIQKEKGQGAQQPSLEPKLGPTQAPGRRISQLGE